MDPADAFKFGLKWQNRCYRDVSAAFGWVHGSVAFHLTFDAISDVMHCQGCHAFAYIDDYVMVSTADLAHSEFEVLSAIITDLGLPLNPDKKTPPTRRLTCLGSSIDLDANTLSIENSKLEEIYAECLQTRIKTHLTRRKFQSFLCKFLYLHKIIKPARIFVNRMLGITSHKGKVSYQRNSFRISTGSLHFYPPLMALPGSLRTPF